MLAQDNVMSSGTILEVAERCFELVTIIWLLHFKWGWLFDPLWSAANGFFSICDIMLGPLSFINRKQVLCQKVGANFIVLYLP